jgi:hypothetical protein
MVLVKSTNSRQGRGRRDHGRQGPVGRNQVARLLTLVNECIVPIALCLSKLEKNAGSRFIVEILINGMGSISQKTGMLSREIKKIRKRPGRSRAQIKSFEYLYTDTTAAS